MMAFDYQLDRHCSKTQEPRLSSARWFDYQLDRHCSKTLVGDGAGGGGLITS